LLVHLLLHCCWSEEGFGNFKLSHSGPTPHQVNNFVGYGSSSCLPRSANRHRVNAARVAGAPHVPRQLEFGDKTCLKSLGSANLESVPDLVWRMSDQDLNDRPFPKVHSDDLIQPNIRGLAGAGLPIEAEPLANRFRGKADIPHHSIDCESIDTRSGGQIDIVYEVTRAVQFPAPNFLESAVEQLFDGELRLCH
jgi:hypothetical protein